MSIGGILLIGLFIYGFIVGVKHDADAPMRRRSKEEASRWAYKEFYK